jgi:hypothetical protein
LAETDARAAAGEFDKPPIQPKARSKLTKRTLWFMHLDQRTRLI